MKRILLSILFFLPFLVSAQNLIVNWANAIGGAAGNEVIQSTVVDASGFVYIGGSFEGTVNFNPNGTASNLTSAGFSDAFFAKYTSAGLLVWANRLGSTGSDEVYAITVDGSGNVYVAGYFNATVDFDPSATTSNLTASGSDDIFYGKYSSVGALTWANAHGSADFDAAVAIKVDPSGNVYVTGYFTGTVDFDPSNVATNIKTAVGTQDIFLGKFSSAGALMWIDTFGSATYDAGVSIDLDNSNVYISGSYSGTIDLDPGASNSATGNLGGDDVFFAKYALSTGALVWWATIRSSVNDQATSIVVSGTNFYLGGVFSGSASFYSMSGNVTKVSNGGSDIFIAKYDGATSLPTLTWLNTIGGSLDDRSNLLAIDASANVYSTGFFQGTVDFDPSAAAFNLVSTGLQDIYLASYSAATGAVNLAKKIGGTSDDEGTTIAIDASNNVYTGGYFQGTASFDFSSTLQNKTSLGLWDGYIAKYSPRADEPTAQPTNLVFNTVTSTGFKYDFTASSGSNITGYVNIRKSGSAPTFVPVDGTAYSVGQVQADGSIIDFIDNFTTGDLTGLTANTTYHLKIFAYNGSGTSINYLTTSPLSGTTTTLSAGWITKASMVTPRWGSGIGNIGEVAYVAGGYQSTVHLATVEAYTVSTNSWLTKAARPGVQTNPAYGVINSTLYTAGGTNTSIEISDLWSYNSSNDTWTSKASLPSVRQSACGGVINGLFYVTGGRVGSVSQSSLVVYDPVANTWSTKTSMTTARYAAAAGVINGLLYVAGGRPAEDNTTAFSTLEAYDPVANTWTTRASMPTARWGTAYAVINGKLYVIGGGNATQTIVSTVEAYDPTSNTWSTIPSLSFARAYATAIVSNGSIYVTGGHNNANAGVAAMEQYVVSTATPAPTITSFAPINGTIGTPVTITGTNFSTTAANNIVKFNGTAATITGTPTATSIVTSVPTGATTGFITVEVGGQTGTSSTSFTVTTVSLATEPTNQPTSLVFGTSTINSIPASFTAPATAPAGYIAVRKAFSAPITDPVDGTAYTAGATLGDGVVAYSGSAPSFTDTGLPASTTYFYKIYSFNGSSTTSNYLTSIAPLSGSKATLLAGVLATEPSNQPTGLTFSSITSTSYSFSYTAAVAGTTAPDGYIGIRKIGSAPTGVPADGVTYAFPDVIGDGTVNFVGAGTNWTQDLATLSTTYHFAIYSYKGSGTAINYKQVSPLTGSVTTLGTDTTEPFVNNNTTATSVAKPSPINVTVTLTDVESGIVEATIYYATLEDAKSDYSNFTRGTMIKGTGDNYTFQIPGSFVKDMGVTYYFYLKNGVGLTNYSSNYFVAVKLTGEGLTIPFSGFGTDQTKYRIVSIPVQPIKATADDIFGDDFGAYDKTKWRLFRYQGSTKELNGASTLEVGNGYWLIASKSVTLDTGPGTTATVAVYDPFKLTLSTGWNQIGNPYPYDIKWQSILDWNGNPAGITKLRTYNSNWVDGTELEKFSGGFVFNGGSSLTLEIPTIKDPSINGRVGSSNLPEVKNSIDQEDWSVNLLLEQGSVINTFGGFGMNHAATEGYDAYDDFNLPRFTDFIELNHLDKELHHFSYSKDVVPFQENHTWEFSVESNSKESVTMKWDNSFFGNNSKQLVLWDMNLQRGLDMRKDNQYVFNKSRSGHFKIFFGDEQYVKEKTIVDRVVFHEVFPNPAKDMVTISFSVPGEERVTIDVIDLLGRKIATVADGNFKPGYHEVSWNTQDDSGNGVTNGIYITQIKSLYSDQQKRLSINK